MRFISAALGLENVLIMNCYRLGRKEYSKTRPLRMVLESKAQRKFLLDNARFIQSKAQPSFRRVIITKDLTPKQREERRAKFQNKRRNTPSGNSRNNTECYI